MEEVSHSQQSMSSGKLGTREYLSLYPFALRLHSRYNSGHMKPTPDKSASFLSEEDRELSRRSFLRFMGAGALLAGMTLPACRRVERYLVPANEGPEWNVPGLPTHYATCMPSPTNPVPMVAVCRDGRPIKLEPSPQSLFSTGLDACTQASILGLYDPARSRHLLFHNQPADPHEWEGAFRSWAKKTVADGKIGFITGEDDSPARASLLEDIHRRNPKARFFFWEPVSTLPLREALSTTIAPGARQSIRWEKVRRVLAVECDFLGTNPMGNAREFINQRISENSQGPHSRLYAAEGRLSLTGATADHRLGLHPADIPAFLIEVARQISQRTQSEMMPSLPPADSSLPSEILRWITPCVNDLCSHSGHSLVILGSSWPQELHRLVLSINAALKAPETCLAFLKGPLSLGSPLSELPETIRRGEIETLFIMGETNPVADAPASIPIESILRSPNIESIHLGLYVNETAKACKWHIPACHYLESWGIERNTDGFFLYRQPVISPLRESFSDLDILAGLLRAGGSITPQNPSLPTPAYDHVRQCFRQALPQYHKESDWKDALRRGFSPETAFPATHSQPKPPDAACMKSLMLLAGNLKKEGDIYLQCVPGYASYDGRSAANAWLQECPDPITGLSWDASAQCSPSTASSLLAGKTTDEGILEISLPGKKPLQFVLCLIPGMPDDLIVLPLGYGTINPLFDGKDELHANAFALGNSGSPLPMRMQREYIRILPQHPHAAARRPPERGTQTPWTGEIIGAQKISSIIQKTSSSDPSNQWGMSIDLGLCTGCNACVVACQAENNIPVVGREQLINGRMMQWMRIDKYLVSSGSGTSLIPHPVACQQCGNAPCESVCPVNATVHTQDGLNAMVYARCWGTRYCAANCPYKARRFNFFEYSQSSEEATQARPSPSNPSVTVRSRGVMEKCTYCVQRIEQAKARHKAALMAKNSEASDSTLGPELTDEQVGLPDGAVQTACQLVCPVRAIRFGNMLHPASSVTSAKSSPRTFSFLTETGTFPRTSYLKRTGNPNPDMP